MDTDSIFARLREGDAGALEELVRQHQARALRTAYLVTGDRSLAEDVVQEAFLRVYAKADQFDVRRPFEPWFLRIVSNDALKAAAARGRMASLDETKGSMPSLAELLPDPVPGPDRQAEIKEMRASLWAAVCRLSPAQRAVVVQRYYLGLTEREAASEGGRAAGTVKHLLHRARERLRSLLGAEGIVAERAARDEEDAR